MGAFAGDFDGPILRIPPASPSRRDYQLRSASPSPSPSRPQSPWRPREQVSGQVSGQEVDTFRLYESYPPARSNYYSGPLPSAPQGVDRSFYSGPLPGAPQGVDRSYYSGPLPTVTPPQPSFSGPLSSGFSTTTTESFDFEFSTWAKIYHRQHDSNSMAGSPDVGSSHEGKSVRGHNYDDDAESGDDEPSSFYLSNPAESRARAAAEFAERAGKQGRGRNCVSGELGVSEEIAQQKSQVERGYKSGEISGLNICADGIYNPSSPVANVVTEHQHSGAIAAWDALMNDAKKENSNAKNDDSNSEMVAIPFKWEGVSGKARVDSVPKKPNSRVSSISTKPNSRTSSTSSKPNSRTSSTSTVSQKPNSRTSSTPTVSQKPNSRTSSTPTVSRKPNSRTSSTTTSTVSQKPTPRTSSTTTVSKKQVTSSTATQEVKGSRTGVKCLESEFSFGGSHKFFGVAAKVVEKEASVREEAEHVTAQTESTSEAKFVTPPPVLKPVRTSTPAAHQQEEIPKSPFSVPFKWEDEPGKAKLKAEAKTKPHEEVAPALQLPPRLVSASVKGRSLSSSTKPTKTSTKQSRSGSASESESTTTSSVGNHSGQAPSSRKFFDKDCFRRCRRLLVNLF